MRTHTRWILLAALLTGCNFGSGTTAVDPTSQALTAETPSEGGDGTTEQHISAYSRSLCRLYVDPTCQQSALDTCTAQPRFGSESECMSFLDDAVKSCAGAQKALAGMQTQLDACAAHISAHDCAAAPMCSGSVQIDQAGPCAGLAEQMAELCEPGDTGS